jgi:hypothetical protein
MLISNPMMNISYDSQQPEENLTEIEKMIAPVFAGLIGKSFSLIFGPDGSVKSITGIDEIIQEMMNDLSAKNPAIMQSGGQLLKSFNSTALKQSFEQSFKIYPDKPVKIGDSWEANQTNLIMGLEQTTHNIFTLKSIENNIATIDIVTGIAAKPEDNEIEGELSGSQEGQISMDIKTGTTLLSVLIQKQTGKFNAQGNEIKMDTDMKIRLQLQKK